MKDSVLQKIVNAKSCKCGCKYRIYAKSGPHIGLYCKNCLKWISWVPSNFIRLDITKLKTIEELKNQLLLCSH